LLVLNSALIVWFHPPLADPEYRSPRIAQIIMFVGPVALAFLEWWIVDLVMDIVTPRRKTRP